MEISQTITIVEGSLSVHEQPNLRVSINFIQVFGSKNRLVLFTYHQEI